MNHWTIILASLAAGAYTALGVHVYSLLASRAQGNLVRFLLFPIFIILFFVVGFLACASLDFFWGSHSAKPSPFPLICWIGVIGLYLAFNWRVLRQRFGVSLAKPKPSASIDGPFPTAEGARRLGYLPELDGLRGFAIICVILTHATTFVKGGFIGVDIFFVLSGFLITALLVQEFDRSKTFSLRKFYLRRALRLGPALLALLIVFLSVSCLVFSRTRLENAGMEAVVVLLYMSNWARAFWIHAPIHLGHTWSLSVEEQFYLLWPVLLLLLLRVFKGKSGVVSAAVAIGLLSWGWRIYMCRQGASPERTYNGLDTRLDSLMTGCALAAIWTGGSITERMKSLLRRVLFILTPVAILGLIAFTPWLKWNDPAYYYWGLATVDCLTAVVVLDVLLSERSFVRRFLRSKWLVWVGSISYGLYLWHGLIFPLLEDFGYAGFSQFMVGLFLSFLISALSYYGMEKPLLELKQRCR